MLHLCQPATVWGRRVAPCASCGCRRRVVGMMQVWYDTVWTCCTCGDSWSGDERLPRPFKRGWRREASDKARARWATALPMAEACRQLVELARSA